MKISKENVAKLRKNFPQLEKFLTEGNDNYDYISFSVFDHQLELHECGEIYQKDIYEINNRRSKFEKFISIVYRNIDTYLWKYKLNRKTYFYRPSTLKSLLVKCDIKNQTWKTDSRYDIIIPEYSAIISDGSDWTNQIWYLDIDKIEPLMQMIEEANLFVLS